jgi:glycosyltransferase involved in cell wall biosynthesis
VPYGTDLPPTPLFGPTSGSFEVVFVGSGGQRKGLHHLLMAWKGARLPSASRLTLVCRVLDKGVEALAARTPGVRILRGVAPEELSSVYASSHLFAMPSLVEGFGQVYLEALSHGCPVLGTPNTALPDLGGEEDGIFVTPAANLESLTSALERLSHSLPGNAGARKASRATAARFTWRAFREGLRRPLTSL